MTSPRILVTTALLGSLASIGCDGISTESVPNTQGTDRIWAAANAYCARKPNGLICWKAEPGNVTAHEPTVFDGLGKVSALALQSERGCAASDLGMGCFQLSDKRLTRGGQGAPEDFVAFGEGKRMHCAGDAEGVSCFADDIEKIKPVAAFGKPRDLHPTLRGGGVCAAYDKELRCFTTNDKGELLATMRIPGVKGVKGVRVERDPGWVLVLDDEGLKLGMVDASIVRGRPIAEDEAKTFPDAASVALEPVKGVRGAKRLTAESSWTYVLDDEGVKSISMRPQGLEVQNWAMEFKPTDLWQGKGGSFFVAHGGGLSMFGWKGKESFGDKVRGVKNPRDVAAGEHFACIVHDGGVSCVKNEAE